MDERNISSSSDKLCPSRTNSTRKLLSKLLRHKSRSRSVPPPINNSPPLQRKSFEEPSESYLILKTKNIQGKKCRRNSGPPIPSEDFSIKHGFFANSSANLSFIDSFFKDNCNSSKDGPADGSRKSEYYSGSKVGAEDKVNKILRRGNPKNEIAGPVQSFCKVGIPSSSSVSDLDKSKMIHSKAMRSKSDHNVRDYVSSAKYSSEKSSRTSSSASLSSFKLSPPGKNKPLCGHKDCNGKHCLNDENRLTSSVDLQEEEKNKVEVDKDKPAVKGKDRSIVLRSEVADMSPSMDSLAKQALLAAKVLNLIPTNKARERNYLHGRIAAMSLMGPLELEKVLPCREVTIFVGTWNMNGQAPPKELNDFLLPEALEHVPDLVAVGTQESYPERFEWEVSLQETLGPSHVLLHSASFGTLHLAVFIRRDLLWFCSVAEDASMSTRPGTAFRTKGAIAIGFLLFGTSFLFLTSHLTAHTERFKDRINDIRRITTSIDLPKLLPLRHKSRDIFQNFDCAFWCGDLNFRLDQPREEVMEWIVSQQFPSKEPLELPSDQLQKALAEGVVFKSFGEAGITFPPTYKFDPGTDRFDSSGKMRTPSYTDRILFKPSPRDDRKSSSTVECLHYYSSHSIKTSDHKPVWSVFQATIRPGKDTVPLAAGLFNRDVYLEGIKRRAAAIHSQQGFSTVCSVQ